MRRIITAITALVAAVALPVLVASPSASKGVSPATLGEAGWSCTLPNQWVHCVPPGAFASDSTFSGIMVFRTDDTMATEAEFLGTERIIRNDLYHGQPCPQEDAQEYIDVAGGLPYKGCHTFNRFTV